jgi:hypothetical protein
MAGAGTHQVVHGPERMARAPPAAAKAAPQAVSRLCTGLLGAQKHPGTELTAGVFLCEY